AELFYVGRNVEITRAERMGLVNEVVDPAELDERVLDLATEIPATAPLSLAGNKRVIRTLRDQPLPEDVERELIELRESCFRSEDFREGVRAFAEKRKPRWEGGCLRKGGAGPARSDAVRTSDGVPTLGAGAAAHLPRRRA